MRRRGSHWPAPTDTGPGGSDPDRDLVRTAARSIGRRIALACAIVVVIVGLLAYALTAWHHYDRPPGVGHGDPDDTLIRDALLIAGAAGVIIAGLVGFLIARRAVRPLGEALALQRRFVADAGHELRTPLTILHTRAQLLARRLGPQHAQAPLVGQLLADSQALSELIEDLLISAQLQRDPRGADTIELADLAAQVARSVRAIADPARIAVVLDAAPGLTVRGSRAALRRALTALVDNALAHCTAGGTIRIAVCRAEKGVDLAVIDDGEGIDPADVDRLLERFARGTSLAPGSPGAGEARRFGLGLALVREVALTHGGDLAITGSPGRGATVTIRLPLNAATPERRP